MHPVLRNILALVAGLVVGSIVNMGIVNISGMIIPPPEGVDVTSMESLGAAMHLFTPIHYLMPFLAHALGTFVGAWIAARFAFSHNMKFALGVGCFFLLGGIGAVYMLPAPLWFEITDLVLAYLPMAWLGGMLAGGKRERESERVMV